MADRLLIVDDEDDSRDALAELVESWGLEVRGARDGAEALQVALAWHPDAILSDLVMPGTDGLWLLRSLRSELPEIPVVFLTGRGSVQSAVQAIKEGAYDFIEKPLEASRLRLVLDRALERKAALREVELLRRRLAALAPGGDFIAQSPAMQRIFELARRVGPTGASVVVQGESGSGKEVVGRAIHGFSARRDAAFLALNCSAIPGALMESELFGHEKGAFTGASERRPGLLELASGGTLLLDEVAEMPLELQAKLLRVLEERKVRRLGGRAEVEVDVRVLSATHQDLKEAVRRGTFREDLYFRLAVFTIDIPPLRERLEDVPLLAQRFLDRFKAETGKRVEGFSPGAMRRLQAYAWPGNVRELRNVVERATILCDGEMIRPEHLPPELEPEGTEPGSIRVPLGETLEAVEREYLLASLQRQRGNKARTAESLGISEKTLYNKLHRYADEAVAPAGPAVKDR
ncbi:MAG TPA: sigma-54 dependent transcriptional regulator [Anaeromyxobacteraceae bacterium]|nr:sigma-54 dependent transcriptional regulator [Anaeromyxobacteraceae bacterium]